MNFVTVIESETLPPTALALVSKPARTSTGSPKIKKLPQIEGPQPLLQEEINACGYCP